MKTIIHHILFILTISGNVLADGNLIYLNCEAPGSVPEITFIAIIDLDNNLLTFPFIKQRNSEYKIIWATTEEIYATKMEPEGEEQLTINRINGKWLLKSPVNKKYNKNFRNPETNKHDYTPEQQLFTNTPGLCKNAKPLF